jgi:hypothetical protein
METWTPDISVDEDAAFSRRAFLSTWPHICHLFGPGAVYRPVEDDDEKARHRELDLVGGIDGYIVQEPTVRTVAQRTQRIEIYPRANTFTLRRRRVTGTPTEYAKRLEAINRGDAVPSLTIQTYFSETHDGPMKVGIAHTVGLYQWAYEHPDDCEVRRAQHGGNEFLVVKWLTLGLKSDVPYATWYPTSRTRGPIPFFNRPTWPKDRWI